MKTEIWVSFHYGSWALVYSKVIELTFTPFIGLNLVFNDEKEYNVTLENNDYCRTTIVYSIEKQQFEIYVRNIWRNSVTYETIDYIIEQFSDWEKRHNTNIDALKELMSQEYKRVKVKSPDDYK